MVGGLECGFVAALGGRRALVGRERVSARKQKSSSSARTQVVRALQTPFGEGPPPLDDYFESKKNLEMIGADAGMVKLGTGRGLLRETGGDLDAALKKALDRGMSTLGIPPQLVHVTLTTDVDVAQAQQSLIGLLPANTPLFGRTIAKDGAEGMVEIMMLAAGGSQAAVEFVSASSADKAVEAARAAASQVAEQVPQNQCQFLVFGATPGLSLEQVRAGLATVFPNAVAYGGHAAGVAEESTKWALLVGSERVDKSSGNEERLVVGALPGQLPFMLSAVVKTWAQPLLQAPLSFLIPNYTGDHPRDLLTAIRFDDFDKFLYLIEEAGVGVNHVWEDKQRQTPLLAAVSRGHLKMVRYLLANGADPLARNDGNYTSIKYAEKLRQSLLVEGAEAKTELEEGLEEIIQMLLDAGAVPEPLVETE